MQVKQTSELPIIPVPSQKQKKSFHPKDIQLKKPAYQKSWIFMQIAEQIINHPEYQRLKEFYHHQHSIYEHSLQVAWKSFKVASLLDSFFTIEIEQMIRGALLHDFFLYDWHIDKPESGKLHAFEHPKEALKNAQTFFPDITPIEVNIIRSHMWPLTLHQPKFKESFIVIIVDKCVAFKEVAVELLNKLFKQLISLIHRISKGM